MSQTRSQSILESVSQVFVGFVINFLIWIYVAVPLWDLKLDLVDNLNLTLLFTIIAVIRQYLFRRIFNKYER